jgi:hypothetical protein
MGGPRDFQVDRFEAAVRKSFSFLEENHGFARTVTELRDAEFVRDTVVAVPYVSDAFGLEVQFRPAESLITSVLYELQGGRKPARLSFCGHAGFARGINLESYIAMVTDGRVAPVLPPITQDMTVAAMGRIGDERARLVANAMEEIVANLAGQVERHGLTSLEATPSQLAAAQEYHKKMYGIT